MKEKIRKFLPIIVFGVIFVVALFARQSILKTYDQRLAKSNQELMNITNQRDSNVVKKDSNKQAILDEVTGLDLARQKHDDALAEEVFDHIFTWDDYKSYVKVRDEMIEEYEMNESVVSRLMPDVPELIGEGGKKFNQIDADGLNMSYQSLKSYVVRISGTDYSYITEVKVSSDDKAGNSATGVVLMSYDVSINGNISNINGFTLMN